MAVFCTLMLSWCARMFAWDWSRRDWRHQEGSRGDMARGSEREEREGPELTGPGTPHTIGLREAAAAQGWGPTIKLLWSRSCRLRPRAGAEQGSGKYFEFEKYFGKYFGSLEKT